MPDIRRCCPFVLSILVAAMLFGCAVGGSGSGKTAPAAAGSGAAPSAAPTEAARQTPDSQQATEPPKNATWVIEINDTQQVTDEMGIIWNYTLTFHASKPGGTDVTGEYAGEANLTIEPDFDSVQAAAASEGTILLSMIFNYYANCESLSFVVEKFSEGEYTAGQREFNKDAPLHPLEPGTDIDFFSFGNALFSATQEPITMTIQEDDGPRTGSGGGGGDAVNVPIEISVDGASVYLFIYNAPHALGEAFEGIVTGDVLPS
jgi:hypothetical protein